MSDTQPTVPLPEWAQPAPVQRRRRRAWPWLIALLVVVGLAVAAWFAGEAIARGIVTSTIRQQVITQLSLPADQQVDVTVEGAVIPQLIDGTLDDITVASDDVSFGQLSGDVTVRAEGVPIRGDAAAESISATLRLDEAQLKTLLSTVDALPVDTIGLAAPNLTATVDLTLFGARFPIGIALSPSAADGDIVLAPVSLQLAGATITADDLRGRFGSLADSVITDYTVCIAQYIPSGVTLSALRVEGDQVIADLDVDGAIISDPTLQQNGTCS